MKTIWKTLEETYKKLQQVCHFPTCDGW